MARRRRRNGQIPFATEAVGPNPTDRAKAGTKRSLLVEGRGVPIAVVIDGANRHDMKMLKPTIASISAPMPEEGQINLCLDKGYDYPEIRELVAQYGWSAHIKARGEENTARKQVPGFRARRWVVERTHSWMNRFRRLLIRWEKKSANYLAMLHIACAHICLAQIGLFG